MRLISLCAVLALAATASAGPNDKPPPPKPPSTGKELEKKTVLLPADEQAAIVRYGLKQPNCNGHVAVMSTGLSVGAVKLTMDERIKASEMLQDCAKASKSWHAFIQASTFLLDHAPEKTNAEDIIGAFLAVGDEKTALVLLKYMNEKVPSQKANVAVAATLIDCHQNNFQKCFNSSGRMLEFLAKLSPPPSQKALVETQIFHAFSAAALGKYDVYDAEIKKIEAEITAAKGNPGVLANFKTTVEQARGAKLFIDDDHASELALGTYHLLASGKIKNGLDNADALVTLRLVNQDKKQRSVKVTVEIAGVTDAMTETVALPAGTQVTKLFSPPIKIDFDVTKLRAARASNIAVHIVDPKTNASLVDKTLAVQVLPRDALPLRRRIGNDEHDVRTTFNYAAAWVTPNAPEIDAFIKKAKARLTGQDAFSGEQQGTIVQVKALFDELKAHGVTYVEDPSLFDERGSVQRTRLPAEVLASTNAQCLEGTLLYATLFEAIGLRPILVFKKGHAFIGWRPSKYDKSKDEILFLETTMTGGAATFEQAMDYARNNYIETAKERQFELGIGALIDIAKLRAQGYTAQPY